MSQRPASAEVSRMRLPEEPYAEIKMNGVASALKAAMFFDKAYITGIGGECVRALHRDGGTITVYLKTTERWMAEPIVEMVNEYVLLSSRGTVTAVYKEPDSELPFSGKRA